MADIKNQYVYGLDIGTRSVVGTVGYKDKDNFIVVAQRSIEHKTRAMLDGQIHDIASVSETIREVTKKLEDAVGTPLKQVCIAAAGRVLRTRDTHVDMIFEEERETKAEDISNLMSLGIEKAYREFTDVEHADVKFYCVGYSVVKYYLNKYPIGNLVGHKAKQISADIIATFLPDDVVDGLYRAVEMSGLEVSNLTLEPIAAISVAIPEKFRMLNIALVDVGAGTSDISITKEGSICAYGMIPMAGDAMTDLIAQHCLVDFDMAEKIKRDSDNLDTISFTDIMGLPQTITKDEVLKVIEPKVLEEAGLVSDEIVRLNGGKPVSAVFVVGGGGIITGYTEVLSQKLGIVKERVALRGSEVMNNIKFMEDDVKPSSLLVTPIGICLNFYENNNNLIYLTFNGKRMKMYDNGKVTVVDVAISQGFPNDGLFPKRGRALTYSVNGKSKIAKGDLGEAAAITVNGEVATLMQEVHQNDKIVITESTAGVRARIKISDLKEYNPVIKLKYKNTNLSIPRPVFVNGKPEMSDYEIHEDDRVEIWDHVFKKDVLTALDVDPDMEIYVNSIPMGNETPLYEGFAISVEEAGKISFADMETEEVSDEPVNEVEETVSNTEEPSVQEPAQAALVKSSVTPGQLHVMVNKDLVTLKGKDSYVFVDVFDYIDFDLSKPQGKGVVTNLNGRPAEYMEVLKEGDTLEIYWKD